MLGIWTLAYPKSSFPQIFDDQFRLMDNNETVYFHNLKIDWTSTIAKFSSFHKMTAIVVLNVINLKMKLIIGKIIKPKLLTTFNLFFFSYEGLKI